MKQRLFYILLSSAALFLGLLLYLWLREGTYLHMLFGFSPESSSSGGFCSYFVRYSLPDFLWAFGLCCALHAVVLPNGRRSVPVSLFSALVGCTWELLQLAGTVGGTFDPLDCLMYLAAAFAVTMITIINERGRKK